MASDAASTTGGECGGGGVREAPSTSRRPGTLRRVLVTMCWLEVTVTMWVEPLLLRWVGQVTGLAFLVTVLGSIAEIGTALAFKAQPSHARRHIQISRALLLLLAGCAIVGAIASVVPSMAFRLESDDILYEYGLSDLVAPTLWGVIFGTSVSAILVPSPRRLALAAGAGIASWPVLFAICLFSKPVFDLDGLFLVLVPWIVELYVAAAFVASGLAVALAFVATRLAAEPLTPPKAFVASPRAWRGRAGHLPCGRPPRACTIARDDSAM